MVAIPSNRIDDLSVGNRDGRFSVSVADLEYEIQCMMYGLPQEYQAQQAYQLQQSYHHSQYTHEPNANGNHHSIIADLKDSEIHATTRPALPRVVFMDRDANAGWTTAGIVRLHWSATRPQAKHIPGEIGAQ